MRHDAPAVISAILVRLTEHEDDCRRLNADDGLYLGDVLRLSTSTLRSILEACNDYEVTKPQKVYTREAQRRIQRANYVDDRLSVRDNHRTWSPGDIRRPGGLHPDGEA